MTLSHGPLGQSVAYASQYDPSLLFPIARSHNRAALDLHAGALPFAGVDLWNAYELSWLDAKGKPRVAMATFSVPADSPNIIESKVVQALPELVQPDAAGQFRRAARRLSAT